MVSATDSLSTTDLGPGPQVVRWQRIWLSVLGVALILLGIACLAASALTTLITSVWDRLNGETVFMYVLAAGAAEGRALSSASWRSLQAFYGSVAGYRFHSADLGLFVFQYGLDLLDLDRWQAPGSINLPAEARLATLANRLACRQAGDAFATSRRFWGLSSGDGPGSPPEADTYRSYTPAGPIDGTAHLTTTLASVAHEPGLVLDNLREAQHDSALAARGRYGFSNVNVDRHWVGRDVIGIDLGAAVLALDNLMMHNRVRDVFHSVPCVGRGLKRLGFSHVPKLNARKLGRKPKPPSTPPQPENTEKPKEKKWLSLKNEALWSQIWSVDR